MFKCTGDGDLTTLLYTEGYPLDWDDEVFRRVLEQMENYMRHHSDKLMI